MHISVLLDESIKSLNLKDNSIVVDATLGYAGHSSEILKRIPNGHLYSFDQDDEAIKASTKRLNEIANNYTIIKSNFKNLKEKLNELDINKIDGILYDLGVSSPQLDNDYRGFSFHQDAELDMRMDVNNPLSAKVVVNEYTKEELINIFRKYGEEKYSVSIASNIVKYREEKEINSTLELVEIIKNSVPEKYKRDKHPARKVFQAIRIEVNDELNVFESSLRQALDLLNINGRICVITFHSLEDKLCKKIFKSVSEVEKELSKLPVIPEHLLPKFKIIDNIEPSSKEIEENARSRSSRLRVIERVRD